jgi:hypothetical protein
MALRVIREYQRRNACGFWTTPADEGKNDISARDVCVDRAVRSVV